MTNFDIAMRAPVLPAETTPWARPSDTALIASRIDDWRPERSATDGRSSARTALSVCCKFRHRLELGHLGQQGRYFRLSPNHDIAQIGKSFPGDVGPRDHHLRRGVSAHRVKRYCDPAAHLVPSSWYRIAANGPASLDTGDAGKGTRAGLKAFGLGDLTTLVVATSGANMVRPLQFAATWALVIAARRQCIMGSAHTLPRFGYLTLWNSHVRLLSVLVLSEYVTAPPRTAIAAS